MPVVSCNIDGKPGFRWGESGKCYVYDPSSPSSKEQARESAERQGAAAYASGYTGKAEAPDKQSFVPPQAVRNAAARGLKLRQEFGRGGLDPQEAAEQGIGSGVVRAGQLKNGRPISYDTIKRMVSYFSRHASDKQGKNWGNLSNPSAGYIAWLLWGGEPGKKWAEGIKRRVERKMEELKKQRRNFKPGSPADQRHQGQPAKPSERRTGSPRNRPGSARAGGGKIVLSQATMTGLKNKVEEHNEKHGEKKGKRVNTRMLAAVYRRGSGAFSTSHRPGVGRAQWAMARVNHFLRLVRTGKPADPKYITDNDLLPKGHPRSTKKGVTKMDNQEFAEKLMVIAMDMMESDQVAVAKKVVEVPAPKGFHWMDYKDGPKLMEGDYEPHPGASDSFSFEVIEDHDPEMLSEEPDGGEEKSTTQKAEGSEEVDVEMIFPIAKAEERLVTGIVLEPNVVDAHKDFETEDTIREAAYNFLKKYNQHSHMGYEHKMFGAIGVHLVESYVAPSDMELGAGEVKKGSWVITVKVANDEIWKKIKTGEITGFSIGGRARATAGAPSSN